MTTRTPISKKIRFEVFKRHSFTCQYCSAKPPKVPLELDHIKPVCKGRNNGIDDLITTCLECNKGKTGNELISILQSILEKSEGKKIVLLHYKEYQKLLQKERLQTEKDIDSVEFTYSSVFSEYYFNVKFRISVKKFINALGLCKVEEAMENSCGKIYDKEKALAYFCGICWNKIKES
jgi:hypothetical protein